MNLGGVVRCNYLILPTRVAPPVSVLVSDLLVTRCAVVVAADFEMGAPVAPVLN